MRKKKRIPVSIMLLVFLFLLTGCTLGGTKQEAETKVDYYIGVVDDNAPYYYEEDGVPKGYYADFVAAMAKEEPFTYKFVPVDGFIGATNASSGKNILASKSFYTSNICVLAPKSSNISTLKQIKDNSIAAPADTEEEVFAKYLANRYKGRAVPFLSVKEALSDIESGNTQILVADKEYYKQHKETFKSWKVLKTSHRFQNEHRLFMQKDGKLQEIYSKGIKALETNGSLEHFSNTL